MNQATEADHQERYEEAFKLYERALEYFMMAIKCTDGLICVAARVDAVVAHCDLCR